MPQKILGVDLGAWSVKAVLLESSFRGFRVEAAHEEQLEHGDDESFKDRQLDALTKMVMRPEFKADVTVVALPGEQATSRFIQLPYSDSRKIEQTIKGELADLLPFDISDAVSSHQLLYKTDDGGSVTLASAALKEQISAHLEHMQNASLDPRFLPIDVLQLYSLYTHFLKEDASKAETPSQASADASTFIAPSPGGPPDGRLVVDIGHRRTLVCAAGEDGIAHIRVIRSGGRDITRAIAEAYQLEWADAEAGKHEDALVASSRHPAPSDAAQRMSDVVAKGFTGLVRELRRTIQSIRREKRIRVARLDLVGGGARVRNLANYLAEQLNVPVANGVAVEQSVERMIDGPRRGAYALALGCALRVGGQEPVCTIDLRAGEFQFAGQLQNLRQRAPLIAVAAGALMMLTLVNVFARYHVVNKRETELKQQFCQITKKVVGREVCEPSLALSVLREPSSELGTFKLPSKSAFRVAAELSHLVPKEMELTISEMDITPDRVKLRATTTSFDAVEQLQSAYATDECYQDIKTGKKTKNSAGKVEFDLSVRIKCPK